LLVDIGATFGRLKTSASFNPAKERKRVLLVDLGATFGGAEIYLENLAAPLRDHVTVFALCAHPEITQRLRALGIRVFSLPLSTGLSKTFQLASAFGLLPYLLVRYGIDIVQINGYAEIVLVPLARLWGRTAVATRHLTFDIEADHWHQAPRRFIARFLYRRLARFASNVICVSRAVGSEVQELVPANKVTVIPNWVASIPPLKVRSLPRRGPVGVLFVGRLVEHKGLQVLLGAIHWLNAHPTGRPLRLTIVGDGEYRPELERRAVGTDAHFVGFQSNVAPFYEAADVFISPSLGPEGSSLVALEAMARCLPCILSDLPVHREIANNGRSALLFKNGDVEDLAQKLGALIESDVQRQSYIKAGYRAIQRDHNPDLVADAYLRAFGV
jgi:glycosyltransferase involved in cell wall biosynthesis